MPGLNTDPLHGHAALFGVYGMLVCLRTLVPDHVWKEKWLKISFWAMNIGLFSMCVGNLLARLLVCAQHGVSGNFHHADIALDARSRRYYFCRGRVDPGYFRGLHQAEKSKLAYTFKVL